MLGDSSGEIVLRMVVLPLFAHAPYFNTFHALCMLEALGERFVPASQQWI